MIEAFHEISRILDTTIKPFPLDGNIHRFKDSKGKLPFWAIGREWNYKGKDYFFIKYGDWRSGLIRTYESFKREGQTKSFIKKVNENWEIVKEKETAEKKIKNDECKKKWGPIFKAANKVIKPHKYLEEKKIQSNHNAKINDAGTLLIPAYNIDGFVGVQIIFKKNDQWIKRYSPGINKKGSISVFGDIKNAEFIYVAEGFATAATIFEITGIPTIVCWDANNMYNAILTLRSINHKCKIIIAADKDIKEKAKNVGIEKAEYCKDRFSNTLIKIPKFETRNEDNTDFNDLLQVEGPETVLEQLRFSPSDFIEIVFLGQSMQTEKYIYFDTQSLKIYKASTNNHTMNFLLSMASSTYWGERFGYKKTKEGDLVLDIMHCNEKIFEEQRAIGIFDDELVRGIGCWFEGKDVVVNLGDKRLVNGQIKEPKSKYFYLSHSPLKIDLENPLTNAEGQKIIDAFKLLNYANQGHYVVLAGFTALAQIFNVIDWRFQTWITGPKGSGKTAITKFLAKLVFNTTVFQDVTAAGVKQYTDTNAVPIIIDEAEPNSPHSRNKMDAIIEIVRQCSSRMNTKSLRGTPGGKATVSTPNGIFCLSSIQPYLPTAADVSRFFEIEMLPNISNDSTKWDNIQAAFKEIEDYAPRLFSRMIKLIPVMRQNIIMIKKVLVDGDVCTDPREADQYSTALASAFALTSTEILTMDNITLIRELITAVKEGLSMNNPDDDDDDESKSCLDTIMQLANRSGITVAQLIQRIREKPHVEFNHDDLAFFEMRFFLKDNHLFIPMKNHQLLSVLNNTMYYNYSKILKRHLGFLKITSIRVSGALKKGFLIKI